MPRYLGILDFEANCLDGRKLVPQEIIEFPIIVYDTASQDIDEMRTFHWYCRSDIPVTPFCSGLTGITQRMCDDGASFTDVLMDFRRWMHTNEFIPTNGEPPRILFVTVGDWDLGTALPAQCRYSSLGVPTALRRWCNLKKIFQDHRGTKAGGLQTMLAQCGMEFEGRPHSGIDDCRNTARVVDVLHREGARFEATGVNEF